MAASDHTSRDQFIDVFHASRDPKGRPPHMLNHPTEKGPEKDAIFAGSKESALDRTGMTGRTSIHHYRIPAHLLSGEVYGDDYLTSGYHRVHERAALKGENPGLWEGIPVDPAKAATRNVVTRYRNLREDEGSISVVMPKHLIQGGQIQYVGRVDDE